MHWPTSQDYNEAIQNSATSMSDPDLKKGEVVVNAMGLPVPRSGNFADVYQFKGGDGRMWAVKCFTRFVDGLQERYTKIDAYLTKAELPFTVGFKFLAEGVRIRGKWYPILKMEWVEGLTLNEFLRQNADKPKYLHAMMQMWAKLTAKMRDSNIAHADLQHGNVLLVPGATPATVGLKLIDYDGMWVPPLADNHSGEVGHPNFQHPLRLKDRLFNADVDRFPHLVIACAFRATLVGGRALWDKFDNGDNLLFREQELRDPANAKIFKTLWDLNDGVLRALTGHIALSTRQPLRKTPWLDDVLFEEYGPRLSPDQESQAVAMLGVAPPVVKTVDAAVRAVPDEFGDFEVLEDDEPRRVRKDAGEDRDRPKAKKKKRKKRPRAKQSKMPLIVGGSLLGLTIIGVFIAVVAGGKKASSPSAPLGQNEDLADGSKQKAVVVPKSPTTDPKSLDTKSSIPKEAEPKIPNPNEAIPIEYPRVASDADRRAAEWVLSVGGRVGLRNGNRDITKVNELPNGPVELSSVSLTFNNQFSEDGLAVFKGCKNLLTLHLMNGNVGDAGLSNFKECKEITVLSLMLPQVTNAGLTAFKGCKKMLNLTLMNMTNIGDAGLANFQECKDLNTLYLMLPQVSDAGLASFANCKNLNNLSLTLNKVTDAGLVHFAECKYLIGLQLYLNKVTDAGLASFRDSKNLTSLQLSLPLMTDAGLANFKDSKNLVFLDLQNSKIGDAGLAQFQSLDPATLRLDGPGISDAGLAVFKDCKRVNFLQLSNTRASDSGLQNFKDCKNVGFLDLTNTPIGDSGLAVFKDCVRINSLRLGRTKISDVGLSSVKDWTNLGTIDLQFTAVTDAGVSSLKDCAKLHWISLQGTQVSVAGVKQLTCSPSFLDLRQSKVTATDIDELKKSMTRCNFPWDGGTVRPPRKPKLPKSMVDQ